MSEWAEWVKILLQTDVESFSFLSWKKKVLFLKKKKFKPLSKSKQKSFVYRLNFQWRFWLEMWEIEKSGIMSFCRKHIQILFWFTPVCKRCHVTFSKSGIVLMLHFLCNLCAFTYDLSTNVYSSWNHRFFCISCHPTELKWN